MSASLSSALKDVVARMMGGGMTGDQAWTARVRAATDAELVAWARDPLLNESGCGYIGDHIAAEMERRLVNAPPLAVKIIDYGSKSS